MKPWQVVIVSATLLNSLVIIAFYFAGSVGRANSVLAAAFIPTLISTGLLYWVGTSQIRKSEQLQKINIIGFFLKVVLLGIWAAILLNAGTLDEMTFVAMLLINFLAWHGVEAYYWPLFMAGAREEIGEKS